MAGRKPIKIDLTLVEKYAAMGMNNAQIAECLGICRDTLYRRKNVLSEFSDALSRGRAKGVQIVSTKLMEQISSGNFQAMKFYLEAKGGWTTTPVIRACDLDIQNMTADQIRVMLADTLR